MALQLQGLALHLQEAWLHRLRTPARSRPGGATRFLMTYFPHPPGGWPALLPYARQPWRERALGVARVEEQRPRRQKEGRGWAGARCVQHGSPSCRRCLQLGWGISRCCRAGHEGHRAPGQAPPPPTAPVSGFAGSGTGGTAGGSKRALCMAGGGRPVSGEDPAGWSHDGWPGWRPRPTATWCPRPDVHAERAHRAQRQQMTPPPPPSGSSRPRAASLAASQLRCWYRVQVTAPPLRLSPPPPLPTGQVGQAGRAGGGTEAVLGTAHRAQHQGAPAARCAPHGALHHDSACALQGAAVHSTGRHRA